MNRVVLALALLLAALPVHASGAGSGIRWNSCQGTSNRNFACDRSTGSELLVGSFQTPAAIDLCGIEVYMRVTTTEKEIPAWWRMWNAADCRRNAASLSVDLSEEAECEDPWQGQATGLYAPHSIDARGLDLRFVIAVPEEMIRTISPGRSYAGFRWTITHARSNGAASCAGCETPACIVIERMVLATMNKRDVELTQGMTGIGGNGNIATWQGGTPSCGAGNTTKRSTWSELKKRYQ